MFSHIPLLSLLVWIPMIGSVAVMLTGGDQNAKAARTIALAVSIISMLLCVPLYLGFDNTTPLMQFKEQVSWITDYGINYSLGVDGISMPMVILTTFTSLIVVLAAFRSIKVKVAQYLAAFLLMQGMMIGVFVALDSILFYVFWEGMLIPMYICIGVWGMENRSYASIKFFLYTFLGSALMLVALLYLGIKANNFAILSFYPLPLNKIEQTWIFLAFLWAFAVKIPMWPVHTWLPDAHTEAPAGGSVVLAALMLKMGVYGFFRFSLPIVPDACRSFQWLMIVLSLIAIVYIGFVAIAQTDMKKLIAYSSIAHMGFATLGTFMVYQIVRNAHNFRDAYMSLEGAMVQMISHAFSTGAMFFGIGVLYDRVHSRMIKDFGGVAHAMPVFAAFFMLFAMSNVGLPGTSGFVGEFMIILSAFKANAWVTFFAASTLIIAAAYTLWLYKRVFFGPAANEKISTLTDISGLEVTIFVLLAIPVIYFGFYPEPLLEVFHSSVAQILYLSQMTKLA